MAVGAVTEQVDPKKRLQQLIAEPGQTPGINPAGQYGGINPSANTGQSPDFNPGGQAGQSGQYGGINPGGGLDTSPGGPVLGSAAGQGGVMDTTQPVPYGGGASTQPAPPTDPGGPDTSPGGPTPIPNTVEGFQSWVQSTFGRQATPQELQQVSSRIGPPGGPNGTYTPQQMQAAQAEAQRMAQAMGGGQTPAPGQPAPAPATPPAQSAQQQQQEAQQRWTAKFGRAATPQEMQRIGNKIGAPGGPNGTYTPEQVAAADAEAEAIAREQGWNGPTTPTTPTTPEGPPPISQETVDQSVLDRLNALINRDPNSVNTDSPEYRKQRDSFRRGQGRAMEQAKNAAAERGASQGTLDSGGFDAEAGRMDIEAAQGEGDFESALMQQELGVQRDQMMQALQLAQQSGLTREANQLQEKLANLDATIRREGLALQGKLGQSDLDLRKLLGIGQLGLGQKQLEQQGTQFGQQLGYNYWNSLQNYQNQAIQQLLGGV